MKGVNSLVRPTITWGLTISLVALTSYWAVTGSDAAKDAAASIAAPTGMILNAWFRSREEADKT